MRIGVIFLCLITVSVLCLMEGKPAAAETVTVGDERLQVVLNIDEKGFSEVVYKVGGRDLPGMQGRPWLLETDCGTVTPGLAIMASPQGASSTKKQASFHGSLDLFDWNLVYEVTGSGRITKTLIVNPKKDFQLKTVSLWDCASESAPFVSSTSMQDIAAFYRQEQHGLFVSLDFPYSKITREGQESKVTYPPYEKLQAGKQYVCHSLTMGATDLTGRMRYGFDEGEVDAVDSYIQERFPPRFNRPMFVSTCINNRYTQPNSSTIFYTMKDHPTLNFNPELLKREISLMPKLGMEYYQVWTGPFDSVPGDPDPKFVREVVNYAKKQGVRIGDYSGTNSLFCVHYNEHQNSLENHPEWGIKASDVCFGNPKFVQSYRKMVVDNDKRYNFEIHCLDFLNIQECNNPEHGHPLGRDSIYSQVKGLIELLEGIDSVSPEMMSWSNSGNWAEFLPKIAWTNHNLYLTDPFIAAPWQGLNMTRLLDDARREQMVSLHYSRFIPYRYLTNCQYFFSQNSIVPDIRNYQYGALSTVAVTPNLCLGEIRPWIDTLTAEQQKQVESFYKKWTGFLTRNYDLWKKTYQVGENPGMGSVEIYGHSKDNHGFVFIVNPQYWDRTVEVPLDASLGFTGRAKCEIAELYPVERLRLTSQGPFAVLGSKIPVKVPAQTVLVLEVTPAPETIDKPRMYGLPGTIEAEKDGYLIKTFGSQGQTERCIILLPKGANPIASAEVRDVPKQPKRTWSPTPVKFVAGNGDGVAIDVTFRRDAAPTELRAWSVKEGSLEEGSTAGWVNGFSGGTSLSFPLFVDTTAENLQLPMWDANADQAGLGPLADFCGAYVENAFSETQETWIDLKTDGKPDFTSRKLVGTEIAPVLHPLHGLAKDKNGSWWVQTSFHLPFMYTIGAEPFFSNHTFLVLPFVRQSRVQDIKAWVNGVPLDIERYRYPRNRGLTCFYADLVGTGAHGGENNLVIYFKAQ